MPSDPPGDTPDLPDDLARLPHGRHGLPPEFVERNQRQRLLASLVRGVAEDGYNAVTITTVTDGAGVTTRTFYKYFESVEACYLAAFDLGVEELGEALATAWSGEEEWPLRVRAALAAALDFFSASPPLAALLLTEPFVAGQAISRHYQAELVRLVPFLVEGRALGEAGEDLPETTERGLLGSLSSQIGRKATAGEAEKLPGLLAELTQFVLTPYLGPSEARKISVRQ
ncbi:MAG TPA: TetR/AcrR family transcriptional regulator [Solirubrobacterales bacterium]|nr:TetR/AcrR family transcriptional regulator [Solirubrobacterales bacterium]